MGSHPNAMLILSLTPEDLSRKTYKMILEGEAKSETHLKIGGINFRHKIMEDSYDDENQLSSEVGNIVLFDLVTYGYGELIEWSKLETIKNDLEKWAKTVCEKYHCTYKIFISANYW